MREIKNRKFLFWFRRYFTRDLVFHRRQTGFILSSFFNILVTVGIMTFNTWVVEDVPTFQKTLILVATSLSLLFATTLGDKIKRKTFIVRISLLINFIGIIFSYWPNPISYYLGIFISVFSAVLGFIFIVTIIIHESNILSRGRFTSYNLFMISIFALFALYIIKEPNLQIYLIIPMAITTIYFLFINKYSYRETELRLKSNVKLIEILEDYENWGRFLSFGILAFVLGLSYLRFNESLDIEVIYYVLIGFVIISGVLIDNFGRKPVFIATILFLSIIAIFASDLNNPIWNVGLVSALYGTVIILSVLLFITYSGDATRDENRKFRTLIVGGYLIGMFVGFSIGNAIGTYLNKIGTTNSMFLINQIGAFACITILVLIYPTRDSLRSKEIDWFLTLRQLYVFNENGICLYSYDFCPEVAKIQKSGIITPTSHISEDLISGGLSGIVSLISEITESSKRLRVLDHEDKKILFHYGKYAIFTLITTKYLNILISKLKDFAIEFEETYDAALRDFKGAVSVFDDADYLVGKHFKQRFLDDILIHDISNFEF
ncbi:MAG: hypothetical protein ACTSRZ_08530 [Promethearchaeota archaeon]